MYKSDEEWTKLEKHLKEIYFSNRWSYYGGGKFHTLFESMAYEKLFDKKMVPLLVSNGTMAIELAIRGAFHNKSHYVKLGIPALTVPMVKWAAERSGHVDEIEYLDVDPITFCIREIPPDLDGVVWVHTGGLMSKQTEGMINECGRREIIVIEDISHAYGSSYNGIKAGTIGDFVAGSFFGTKTLTCGEGGVVAVSSMSYYYDYMKTMRNQGKNDNFEQVMDGYNYRASEFTAAIALARLEGLENELATRRKIANEYDAVLGLEGIGSVENELGCITGHYKYIVRTKHAYKLDDIMEGAGFSFGDWVHGKLLVRGDFPGAAEIVDGHVCLTLIEDREEREQYLKAFIRLWKEVNR